MKIGKNDSRKRTAIVCLCAFALTTTTTTSSERFVPQGGLLNYPNVQAAISAGTAGDIIRVQPGTYREAIRFGRLLEAKNLRTSLLDLANTYHQAGDAASGQAELQMTADLGRRYNDAGPGESLLGKKLGETTELAALRAMEPTGPYNGNGQSTPSLSPSRTESIN